MKIIEIFESAVTHSKREGTVKFRVKSETSLSFEQLKNHASIAKYSGPHTSVIDVTNDEDVKKAPGENKWNAMRRLFGHDGDEITCADSHDGKEWLCLAINIET